MPQNIFLSVVIPVYNEQARIHNLKKVISYLQKQKFKTELILVDDGSTDSTLQLIKEFKKNCKFLKIVSYKQNQGKGFAIAAGMKKAKGAWRLFMDVDLSVPVTRIGSLLKNKKEESEIIIGTRRTKKSKVKVRQSKLRENLGRVFTWLSQQWLAVPVSDFTCGFKCFSAQAAQDIFSRMQIKRWGFDAEILFIAQQLGYEIQEVPVTWKNDSRTKVKFPQDLIRSLWELILVRWYWVQGKYQD